MLSNQTKNIQNAGFTLVEIMVVILIMSMLIMLGNYGVFTQRREKAQIEELAVQITTLIDQEKVDALLGKTEGGEIVRKRKITLNFSNDTLEYKSFADLAEDQEGTYCGIPSQCDNGIVPGGSGTDYPATTKTWQFLNQNFSAGIYNCDTGTGVSVGNSLNLELVGDTLNFITPSGVNHVVILISRGTFSWEIHIDKRTGVTYEREKTTLGQLPSCI